MNIDSMLIVRNFGCCAANVFDIWITTSWCTYHVLLISLHVRIGIFILTPPGGGRGWDW